MRQLRRAALSLVSLGAVSCGLTWAIRLWRRRRLDYRVFILEYHDVSADGSEPEGTISRRRFQKHLAFLRRRYRLVTLSQATAMLSTPRRLTEDLVVVTFDDGYAGNFEAAWPVLAAEHLPATVFLTTGFLDGSELWFDFARRALAAASRRSPELSSSLRRILEESLGRWPIAGLPDRGVERLKALEPETRARVLVALREADLPLQPAARPMSWPQVREMCAGGVEAGAHTLTHPMLSALPPQSQEREIRGSSDRIAQETGSPPRVFAFPNGDYDATTLRILERLGFTAACTTRRGSNRPGCDPLTLRRIGVGRDPTWVLAARLSGLFDDELRRRLPTSA